MDNIFKKGGIENDVENKKSRKIRYKKWSEYSF